MKKKGYKKNKKVIEKVIYERKRSPKKPDFSTTCLIFIVFLITTGFYYLNFSFVFYHILPSILQENNVHRNEKLSQNYHPTPLPVNIQSVLLQKRKKSVVAKTNTKDHSDSYDQIIWHGPRDKKEVALTFDADMTPVMVDWLHSGQVSTYDDPRITNYLTQHGISATFFLTGLWIKSYPDATRALAANPQFELENHTYSHPSMAGDCFGQPQVPESQYPSEIEKVQQLLQRVAHVTPKYFRFPGGCYNQADLALVQKEGLKIVHWDDVANDGFNDNEEDIIHNVLSEAKNGSIIVMHIGGAPNVPVTADALPTIIDGLKKRGYTFVTVDELLNPPKIVAQINPKEYLASLRSFQTLYP